MLSIFPNLFDYSQFAPFILRIALAAVLLMTDSVLLFKSGNQEYDKVAKIIQILSAFLLLLGLFIQPVAIVIILLIVADSIVATIKKTNYENSLLKFLIVATALSLLLLGPGVFSIDLPL